MGLGRWSGPCREWSGPRVQGREMWGATHSCWQSDCFTVQFLHTTQKPTANSPDRLMFLLGAKAAIFLLRCLIVLREARRTKGQR